MYGGRVAEDLDYLGQLDPDDPKQASQQIANKLRAAILTRKFQPGERLPSQNDLAERYGVARETVKSALRILREDRLVALLAVHAASPPVGTAYRQGEQKLLFAVDDGTELDDPEFGGADLIVGTALLDAAGMAADRTEAA